MMYKRIITHYDFDGVASAALCSYVLNIDFIYFTGPRAIIESRLTTTSGDVVCDLPYPHGCGLWFDHHEGNMEDLKNRNIDLESLPGRFALLPSCSHVIYDYFRERLALPGRFQQLIEEADLIDGFSYKNVREWRRITPGKIIDGTLRFQGDDPKVMRTYMKSIVLDLRDKPLQEVADRDDVKSRYEQYLIDERNMLEQIRKDGFFLEEDIKKELVIIDQTPYNQRNPILKHLAYLMYPNALGVISINTLYQSDQKTNNLCFSMSLSLRMTNQQHAKNVGLILRNLNLGDGHRGAAAGVVVCGTGEEMNRKKEETLHHIFRAWRNQTDDRM